MSLENANISSLERLVTPREFKKSLPITPEIEAHVEQSRVTIQNILDRKDKRLIVVVGPCSVHDTKAALEYAQRLADFKSSVEDQVMRTATTPLFSLSTKHLLLHRQTV